MNTFTAESLQNLPVGTEVEVNGRTWKRGTTGLWENTDRDMCKVFGFQGRAVTFLTLAEIASGKRDALVRPRYSPF